MAMPAANRESSRRWTAREVRALIAESPLASPRYELVDGDLLVTPSPNWPHQRAASLLWRILDDYLQPIHAGAAGMSPFDVELEQEFISQPDVFVLPLDEARRVARQMPARALLLAAEILSSSSARFDRVVKKPKYLRHVPEYWIVDLDARLIERWLPNDDRSAIHTDVVEWRPRGAAEALRLDVVKYFDAVFEFSEG